MYHASLMMSRLEIFITFTDFGFCNSLKSVTSVRHVTDNLKFTSFLGSNDLQQYLPCYTIINYLESTTG